MSSIENNSVQSYRHENSRTLFGSYNEKNDVDPKSGKAGVRCYNWFAAFFVWCVGKLATITTSTGEKVYLNKNSLDKWIHRHTAHRTFEKGTTECIINDICQHPQRIHKKVKCKFQNVFIKLKAKNTSEATRKTIADLKLQLAISNPIQTKPVTTPDTSKTESSKPETSWFASIGKVAKDAAQSGYGALSDFASNNAKALTKIGRYALDTSVAGIKVGPAAESISCARASASAFANGKVKISAALAMQSFSLATLALTNKLLSTEVKELNLVQKIANKND